MVLGPVRWIYWRTCCMNALLRYECVFEDGMADLGGEAEECRSRLGGFRGGHGGVWLLWSPLSIDEALNEA